MGPFFFQKTAAGIPKTADAALQNCALCALEDGCYRTANVAEPPRHIGRIWCYRNRCPTRCASTPSLAKAHARSLTCARAGACGHARKKERAHTHTHSHNVRKLSFRRSTERAPCEYEGRVQNQGRIMALKNGPCLDTLLTRRCHKFHALVSQKRSCK